MTAISVKATAWSVAEWSDLLARYALAAASTTATPDSMRLDLTKLHAIWPRLCRAMVMLEGLTPHAARTGNEEDAWIRDWIEERAASRVLQSSTASISETA